MNGSKENSENVPSIIDKILRTNDPATVGLRRIIKKKADEGTDFPARLPLIETFDVPGKSKILSEDERRILELEKIVMELQDKLKRQPVEQKAAEEAAFKKGTAEGMKKGIQKGASETAAEYGKKIDTLQMEIATFLQNIEKEKKDYFINSEHILLKLTLEIAGKVIATEVSSNQEVILKVLNKALSHVADRERIVIHVSPQDCTLVSQRKDFWNTITDKLGNIVISEDARIEKGGCLIESNSGLVDARLGVQFDEICSLVEREWEGARQTVDNGIDIFSEGDHQTEG